MKNAVELVSQLTLEEKIGQMLIASLDGLALDESAGAFLDACHIGNIVHFGNNVQNRAQATELNAALHARIMARCGIAPLIGIDHEGGRVLRFREGVTAFPSAMAVGATGKVAYAERIGYAMGTELRSTGFLMNFAPALDVNTNPANPVIGVRSYGDDPEQVAAYGVAMVRGLQDAGCMACGKHFPGHGDTAVDSHFGLPCVDKPLEALAHEELIPFGQAIQAGMAAMMTSHILYPQIDPTDMPATMSSRILQGLLRDQMHFEGLIISDAMHMQAIATAYGIERGCIEAVKAGVDMLCIGTGGSGHMDTQVACCKALLAAAQSGEIPMDCIDRAVLRILNAKEQWFATPAPTADWVEDERLAAAVAQASITRLAGNGSPLQGQIACASLPMVDARYGLHEGNWVGRSFAGLAAQALGGKAVILPDGAQEDALLTADTVIIGISRGEEAELRCAQEALARGQQVTIVLTGLPYLVSKLPQGCEVLCTYGTAQASLEAACRVLRGQAQAAGATPVRIEK